MNPVVVRSVAAVLSLLLWAGMTVVFAHVMAESPTQHYGVWTCWVIGALIGVMVGMLPMCFEIIWESERSGSR